MNFSQGFQNLKLLEISRINYLNSATSAYIETVVARDLHVSREQKSLDTWLNDEFGKGNWEILNYLGAYRLSEGFFLSREKTLEGFGCYNGIKIELPMIKNWLATDERMSFLARNPFARPYLEMARNILENELTLEYGRYLIPIEVKPQGTVQLFDPYLTATKYPYNGFLCN